MSNPLRDPEARMLGDLYTSSGARDLLEALCDDLGSRWTGSAAGEAAARLLLERLLAAGLDNCRLEAFSFTGWERGPARCRVLGPGARDLSCISLPMSPAGRVEAEVLDLGDGHPSAFEEAGDGLRGRIAMVGARPPRGLPRTVHRSEKYQRAVLGGAAAFLYVNQYPGYGPETGSIANDREAPVPGVAISFEDGELLRRLARRHGAAGVGIETTDRTVPATGYNVCGELPGSTPESGYVVLGCHYDGHDISQGAHDPASGAVAVAEAARVLATHARDSLRAAVKVVYFAAEETGLIGARRYVAAHRGELDHVRLMLNLDAAGGPGPHGLVVNRWPELTPIFKRWEREMADELPVGQKTSAFSDHYPFFLEGVPTAMMGDPHGVNSGRGYDHTAWDTVDKVRPADVRAAAAMAARLVLRISREEPWPVRRRSHAEVEALVAAEPSLEGRAVAAAFEALYAPRVAEGT